MAGQNRQIRWSTVLAIVTIVTLACIFMLQQRKEDRLRAALTLYKSRSHGRVAEVLRSWSPNLNWPDQAPLGDVIEQVKLSTRRGYPLFPLGVPIVVDPIGLEEAGRSLSSPVQQPPADQDLSLGKKLQTVLKPLGLGCQVKDASIVITSERMMDEPFEDKYDDE
jgi:hypothetical protein